MPVIETPPALGAFRFHGAEFSVSNGSQAIGPCPFCGAEKKWYCNVESGLWDCKICGETGNPVEFLRKLYDISGADSKAFSRLAADRKLLDPSTLVKWGVVQSAISGDILVPGYNAEGRLDQLYRYSRVRSIKDPAKWKSTLLPTPGVWKEGDVHRIFGVPLLDPEEEVILLCEGPWDGMVLWETLRQAEELEDSDLAEFKTASVVAIPGANVFPESFCDIFCGKKVYLLFDNDHPREFPAGTGRMVDGAGYAGVKRVAGVLAGMEKPPAEVHYLRWAPGEPGSGAEGHDPGLPSGYDVRDFISRGETAEDRAALAVELLAKCVPVPDEWKVPVSERKAESLKPKPCSNYRELIQAWKKAMRLTPGLEGAIAVCMAQVISTEGIGDQLWVTYMSPPSTGKTSICEALATATDRVKSVSTITGLHSGYRSEKSGKTDHSLIAMASGKMLVVKDADTLLKSPNREKILSEFRDWYDTVARPYYRHGASREYEDSRAPVGLFGTGALRELDAADLGARFLSYTIMGAIDDELEDDICTRVVYRAIRNLAVLSNGKAEDRDTPEMIAAKQLTGGYVQYLRKNAAQLLSRVQITDEQAMTCKLFAIFVSYMRARPSFKQQEVVERELAARLSSQLSRLMGCLAAATARYTVDSYVMRLVMQVAMDTSRGRTLDIVRSLYEAGEGGLEKSVLAIYVTDTEEKLGHFLQFLRKIGVVKSFVMKGSGRGRRQIRWRLTDKLANLYGQVLAEGFDG